MATVPAENPIVVSPKTSADRSASLWRLALRRFFRQVSAIVGLTILSFLVFLAITANLLAPYDPITALKFNDGSLVRYESPCIHSAGCDTRENLVMPQALMGTDANGRDLFSRILFGTRLSLVIGFTTVTFAIIVGTFLGAVAGYLGGWIDVVIMRIMDVLLAFPTLMLAIAIVAVLGPGLINALIAIAIVSIPTFARLVRASVLTVRETAYVEASVALGGNWVHILFRRVLPNALTPLVVAGSLGIASAILDAAALSFLGFGAQYPTPEWGQMLGSELGQMFNHPYLVMFPGIMITLTVLAFNLIGDGLRDALDPRLAQSEGGAAQEQAVS